MKGCRSMKKVWRYRMTYFLESFAESDRGCCAADCKLAISISDS